MFQSFGILLYFIVISLAAPSKTLLNNDRGHDFNPEDNMTVVTKILKNKNLIK